MQSYQHSLRNIQQERASDTPRRQSDNSQFVQVRHRKLSQAPFSLEVYSKCLSIHIYIYISVCVLFRIFPHLIIIIISNFTGHYHCSLYWKRIIRLTFTCLLSVDHFCPTIYAYISIHASTLKRSISLHRGPAGRPWRKGGGAPSPGTLRGTWDCIWSKDLV